MENESEWLDCIERFVFEENKIVSYRWLSKELNIHVNVCKRLLSLFIDKTNEELGVCLVVSGVMSDGNRRVIVGWQKDISNIKSEFQSICSEHVYSVQKVSVGDLKILLHSSEYASTNDKQYSCSSIKCDESILRNVAELKRGSSLAAKSKAAEVSTKKGITEIKKKLDGSPEKSVDKSNSGNNGAVANGNKKKYSPKKSSISSMFAAQKNTKKADNKDKVTKQPAASKPKGLNAFFSQGNATKKTEKIANTDQKVKASTPEKAKGVNGNTVTTVKVKEKENDSEKLKDSNSKTSSKSKTTKKGTNKRKKSNEEDKNVKKRKRIMVMSDSESSGEDEGNCERSNSPEFREPTPPPPASDDEDVVPPTPEAGKRAKKKKLIEKHFMDEDGFLVTNKEYVFVSDDDGNNDNDENQNAAKTKEQVDKKNEDTEKLTQKDNKKEIPESKKKVSPQKVKQSSIMSFFKKS